MRATIKNRQIFWVDKELATSELLKLDNVEVDIEFKRVVNQRTIKQNKSLYLYFKLLSDELNVHGMDMKKTVRQDLEIPWTEWGVKFYLWRPIQEALFGTKSTTELSTKDIDKIYDILNKTIAERTGVSVQFPSNDNLI